MPNIPRSILRRRRFLQSSGTVALGALSTVLAGRKLFRVPTSGAPLVSAPGLPGSPHPLQSGPVPESDIPAPALLPPDPVAPAEPLRPLTGEGDYAGFLASLDLRHLSPGEIIMPHRGVVGGIANELPPEKLWKDLAPTLRVADELRERLGAALVRVSSAYRCPRYNLKIPGAVRNSYHTRNQALDLVFACPTDKVVAMARRLRRERFFRGGIGIYPYFIHIDTRGYNANWHG